MLALLQRSRKQTRAPNDSNKPRRRLPLRRRGRAARASGSCGGSGGSGTPVPAAPPASVRGSPTLVRCDRGGWQPGRGVAAGTPPCPPAGPAAQCQGPGAGAARCPAAPARTAAASAGKEKLIFTFVWFWSCKTQDTTLQSKFTFQRADIKRSLMEGWILQTTPRMFPKYFVECLGRL